MSKYLNQPIGFKCLAGLRVKAEKADGLGTGVRRDCPFLGRIIPFSRLGQTRTHQSGSRLRGWCDLVKTPNFLLLLLGYHRNLMACI